jgi:hypothetical protein
MTPTVYCALPSYQHRLLIFLFMAQNSIKSASLGRVNNSFFQIILTKSDILTDREILFFLIQIFLIGGSWTYSRFICHIKHSRCRLGPKVQTVYD